MHSRKLRLTTVLSALLALAAVRCQAASDLGKLDFPTSAAPAAQEHFLRGVAALHSFWYDEAADEFRAAEAVEPGFALAYWGEAMTFNHPIWGEEDLAGARAALAKLAATPKERAAKAATERERMWLAAVEALYGEGEKPARDRAYSAAMDTIRARWPDDVEAGAFYSLSLIGPAWVSGGARSATFGETRERVLMRAAGVLEELFARNPQHPGVVHYLIHSYDDPVHAPLGLRAARVYAQVAPAAHHALHMPSHIFVQLGRWPDVVASNEAAWAASVAWTERRKLPEEKKDFHSLSWLSYAYMQQGRYGKAKETLELARRSAQASPESARIAEALDGMEARYLVETHGDAKLPPAVPGGKEKAAEKGPSPAAGAHCGSPAAHAPQADHGSLLFAAGLAAARRGDTAAADEAVARLRALPKGGRGYGSDMTGVMEKEISGVALLAKGKKEEGLALLAEAAKAEDAMQPPSGPPELLKPALELYGEELLEQGRADEAAVQFHRSLQRMPRRPASLLGAARAATKLGHADEARGLYADLTDIWRQADNGLPEVAEARSQLAAAPAR